MADRLKRDYILIEGKKNREGVVEMGNGQSYQAIRCRQSRALGLANF